jgi:hypothetical protein
MTEKEPSLIGQNAMGGSDLVAVKSEGMSKFVE